MKDIRCFTLLDKMQGNKLQNTIKQIISNHRVSSPQAIFKLQYAGY